jgi:hypothetical protein
MVIVHLLLILELSALMFLGYLPIHLNVICTVIVDI